MYKFQFYILLLVNSCAYSQDKGLESYKKRDFNKARDYYQRLQRRSPENDRINYSLGTTAYQQNDLTTALQLWNSTKNSNDSETASKSYYNLGKMDQRRKQNSRIVFSELFHELDAYEINEYIVRRLHSL